MCFCWDDCIGVLMSGWTAKSSFPNRQGYALNTPAHFRWYGVSLEWCSVDWPGQAAVISGRRNRGLATWNDDWSWSLEAARGSQLLQAQDRRRAWWVTSMQSRSLAVHWRDIFRIYWFTSMFSIYTAYRSIQHWGKFRYWWGDGDDASATKSGCSIGSYRLIFKDLNLVKQRPWTSVIIAFQW